MTIHVSGDAQRGDTVTLHLKCETCGRISSGAPNDAAKQLSKHPAMAEAMANGWRERMNGRCIEYICPWCEAAERREAAKQQQEGSATMGEAKQVKPKQLEIKVPIDAVVIELKRAKLFDCEQEIDKLKAKKREVGAEYTEKIKDRNEARAALMEQIETGMQKVTAPVTERRDDRRACMLIVRVDTGDVVDERAYTAHERQMDIEEVIERKAGATNGAATEAAPKKKRGSAKGRKRAEGARA